VKRSNNGSDSRIIHDVIHKWVHRARLSLEQIRELMTHRLYRLNEDP
jgi:hypothetical protein